MAINTMEVVAAASAVPLELELEVELELASAAAEDAPVQQNRQTTTHSNNVPRGLNRQRPRISK